MFNFFRKKPVIIINFKTYKQGKEVIRLAKKIDKVARVNKKYKFIVGVQPTDIYEVAKAVKLPVFSEHVDPFLPGRYTGFILPEAIKKDKGKGTFLNHSEHPLKFDTLKQTIKRCKVLHLKTAVFVKNIKGAKKVEKFKPTYLIYEPPELVGGRISVSSSKPRIIKEFSRKIRRKFLVGAGIHSNKDFKIALELGASGIALSSAIVKSKAPEKKLRDLLMN